jgi:hypothetical protein
MTRKIGLYVWLVVLGLVAPTLAQSAASAINDRLIPGERPVTVADRLLYETFDARDAWENYTEPQGSVQVLDGVYQAIRNAPDILLWGQNTTIHDDVVMVVDATHVAGDLNNGYGVMCRAAVENTAEGYHLRISSDGYGQIFKVVGDDLMILSDWRFTGAIEQGRGVTNQITAVCVDNYFALYANGQLISEATDDDRSFAEGVAGFTVSTFVDGDTVEVAFDDLEIWSVAGTSPTDTDTANDAPTITDDSGDIILPPPPPAIGAIDLPTPPDERDTSANGDNPVLDWIAGNDDVTVGDLLAHVTFDDANDWETYTSAIESGTVDFSIVDGILLGFVPPTSGLNFWSLHDRALTDSVVSITTTQKTSELDNGYGLMCRADPANDGDGYYFRISGDGFYAITLVQDEIFTDLVAWTRSAVINQGRAANTIAMACVGDYLALYVNGELVHEINDDRLTRGNTGVVLVGYDNTPVRVAFDDAYIWSAE